jgi:hypothetical protein
MRTKDSIDNCVCYQDYIVRLEEAHDEIKRLRKALATYACRCGDCECYVDEFVPSCGRSAREALKLILSGNSLPYAQEIASKALSEQDASPCPTNTIK